MNYGTRTAIALSLGLALAALGCSGSGDGEGGSSDTSDIQVAYVTNGIASFWDVAKAGAEAGGEEFDVSVTVKMPAEGAIDQKEILEDLMSQGYDGIAVSPIDPENQSAFLKKMSSGTQLITHDSDAPDSGRQFYIGMDNYDAGRLCGKLVKEAIPDGGQVMIFVGRLEQLNATERRQGVIDELLDRERKEGYFDPQDGEIKGDKYTIVGTKVDGFDPIKCKEQAQDALVNYPDLACMVGLFAYNPPLMLSAAKDAGRLDSVKIVAFDEDAETLAAIRDGEMHGTVVQNPYEYGRKSVEVLAALARDEKDKLPEDAIVYIPARQIRKDNVMEFWTDLNEKLGEEAPEAAKP